MIILGKTPDEWKDIEQNYRKEYVIFLIGFILGVILI
jgi:uncharacterized protein YcsI (UPF0317 family)|tara:strand:+ start:835 stop:945 length:111 start_codon:yes stop_codon:yes gene_type:complete